VSDPDARLMRLLQVNLETGSFLDDSDLPHEDKTLLTYFVDRASALHRGNAS
jgi:hypothetical protein